MSLPKFQTDDQNVNMLQSRWATELDPLLRNPLNRVLILKKVDLQTGLNQVNHLLGRPLQGWFIVRQRSSASFYDSQDLNNTPQFTLALNSSAPCICDIGVF